MNDLGFREGIAALKGRANKLQNEQDAFKKRVTPGVKRLAGMAKELQVFTGPSMDPDATMVFAYYKEGADAPTFVYFKDAMKAVKC